MAAPKHVRLADYLSPEKLNPTLRDSFGKLFGSFMVAPRPPATRCVVERSDDFTAVGSFELRVSLKHPWFGECVVTQLLSAALLETDPVGAQCRALDDLLGMALFGVTDAEYTHIKE